MVNPVIGGHGFGGRCGVAGGQIILAPRTVAEIVCRGQLLSLSGWLRWSGVLTLNGIFSFEVTWQQQADSLFGSPQIPLEGSALGGPGFIIKNPSGGNAGSVWIPNSFAFVWSGPSGVGSYPPTSSITGLRITSASVLPKPVGVVNG